MSKILWFDVETTGLSAYKNDIIQLAVIITVDGKVVETHDLRCQPFDKMAIDSRAMKIHGITEKEIERKIL